MYRLERAVDLIIHRCHRGLPHVVAASGIQLIDRYNLSINFVSVDREPLGYFTIRVSRCSLT